MMKYFIYTGLMLAATVLAIVPTARTLDPFENSFADGRCDKDHMNFLRAFAIIGCIFPGLGLIAGIAAVATKQPLKIPCAVLGLLAFVLTIPDWAYAAYRWDDQFKCFLPNFPVDWLAMWVCTSGLSLIAMIIVLALADPAAAGAAPADAGNPEAAPEVKSGDDDKKKDEEQTPQPADNSKDDEEAARKKKADEEAAAARKKKADEEAAAAEKKRQQEQQDRDAADAARKHEQEQAAARERQQKQDEEAAAAKKKAEQEEAARKAAEASKANAKPQINWKEVNAKLPYDKKNPDQKKLRFKMFDDIDINKTGKVSLLEITAGMERVLQLPEELHVPVVIKTAFDKAKVAGQQAGVNDDAAGGDFIEKNEFRLFLMYTRMYFEMFQLFSALDETGDMCIELGEFEKAVPLLKTWQAKIEDPAATFKQIDKNGGGKVLFNEFVDWALSPEQGLDCPDEDE